MVSRAQSGIETCLAEDVLDSPKEPNPRTLKSLIQPLEPPVLPFSRAATLGDCTATFLHCLTEILIYLPHDGHYGSVTLLDNKGTINCIIDVKDGSHKPTKTLLQSSSA